MELNRYVVGFLFDNRGNVALINKNRPEWQKGKLNGIGGHIEPGEEPITAMEREFHEEAGMRPVNWRQFARVTGNNYELFIFAAHSDRAGIESKTDELVGWYSIEKLPSNILPNLRWLIPMADYHLPITAEIIHESDVC